MPYQVHSIGAENASANINDFIQLTDQLEDMGEGECPATMMDQCLDQIKN
jgi:hypothetical protein